MAGLKQIKSRIVSVKNTRKITKAMKLVSAAKLKRTQDAVVASREYANSLSAIFTKLMADESVRNFSHPLSEKREIIKTVGLIAFGANRGLCGAYNSAINRRLEAFIREKRGAGLEVITTLCGKKLGEYFRRKSIPYAVSYEELTDDPNTWPIAEISAALQDHFTSNKVDEVYIAYTKFKSAISSSVEIVKILPFESELSANNETSAIKFEPSMQSIYLALIPRLLSTQLRQAALDSKASEHGSRMTAMDAASKNAGDLTQRLQIIYNKMRQGAITAELLDIVGGAEALRG